MEPRNHLVRGADAVRRVEGNTSGSVLRELPEDPARSENHGMYGIPMRENREIPPPSAGLVSGGPLREG
jgi:hypothetical protein